MNRQSSRLLPALLLFAALPACALEYRSVSEAAVLYDAPSQKSQKRFVIYPGTPVEVVVSVGNWIKIRDADGTLSWIEKAALSQNRTLIVRSAKAAIRRSPDTNAPVQFEAQRDVVLELVTTRSDGWAQVRHASGQVGFVRSIDVWGL